MKWDCRLKNKHIYSTFKFKDGSRGNTLIWGILLDEFSLLELDMLIINWVKVVALKYVSNSVYNTDPIRNDLP